MIEFDNIKAVLAKYEEPLKNMAGSLDLDNKKDRAKNLIRPWKNRVSGMTRLLLR